MEVDLLVVDVPSAYNAILGCPTLHKVKAAMTPCLLLMQFELGMLLWASSTEIKR